MYVVSSPEVVTWNMDIMGPVAALVVLSFFSILFGMILNKRLVLAFGVFLGLSASVSAALQFFFGFSYA